MLKRESKEESSNTWARKTRVCETDVILVEPGETDLDYEHSAMLRDSYKWGLERFSCSMIVDLSQTPYLDSSSLGVLLCMTKELPTRGRRLVLVVGNNPMPANILALTRLDSLFRLAPSLEEAVSKHLSTDPAA